ncbi:hypothetical protein [Jatrophihabitans sp. GAS493]|uniref:hypothetical protein n=1 Tax=Jatrophihabitans sp. GAS493 TaxID=1907575 RepID=UPI0012FDF6EF|nr:hypothetical protein [Jatrophihabitans sp. GAS493]
MAAIATVTSAAIILTTTPAGATPLATSTVCGAHPGETAATGQLCVTIDEVSSGSYTAELKGTNLSLSVIISGLNVATPVGNWQSEGDFEQDKTCTGHNDCSYDYTFSYFSAPGYAGTATLVEGADSASWPPIAVTFANPGVAATPTPSPSPTPTIVPAPSLTAGVCRPDGSYDVIVHTAIDVTFEHAQTISDGDSFVQLHYSPGETVTFSVPSGAYRFPNGDFDVDVAVPNCITATPSPTASPSPTPQPTPVPTPAPSPISTPPSGRHSYTLSGLAYLGGFTVPVKGTISLDVTGTNVKGTFSVSPASFTYNLYGWVPVSVTLKFVTGPATGTVSSQGAYSLNVPVSLAVPSAKLLGFYSLVPYATSCKSAGPSTLAITQSSKTVVGQSTLKPIAGCGMIQPLIGQLGGTTLSAVFNVK